MNFKKVRFASIYSTLLILFFFFIANNVQIASWDGITRESVVFTSAGLRSSGLNS